MCRVLLEVGGGDGVQRFLAGKRIDIALAWREPGRCLGEATAPGRNAAVGAGGLFGAGGGEVLAQAGKVGTAQLGEGGVAGQAEEAAQGSSAKQSGIHGRPHV
ncbi:hypothetical protein D3C76_1582160 [compost metagenome]